MSAPWIQTFTGRRFFPLDPKASDVCIEDIAHALSNQCRFAGHVKEFYSVADHSVRVSNLLARQNCEADVQFAGLLHDAAEAYLVDLPTPVKRQMPTYLEAEKRVEAVIATAFDLTVPFADERIKRADGVLLATEARDLMGATEMWELTHSPLIRTIAPVRDPEAAFLFEFRYLSAACRR